MGYKLYDDSTFIDLDIHVREFETGLPAGIYKMKEVMSDGGLVSGIGSLEGRVFEISKTFIKNKEATRQELLDWFTRPAYQSHWLERTTTDFTGRTKVKTAIVGGEKYNVRDYRFSDAVGFMMYAEDPYFTSTSVTSTSVTLTSTTEASTSVTLNGAKNYCSYAISSTADFSVFQFKIDEDYGFRVEQLVNANSTLEVLTTGSELTVKLDNNKISGTLSSNSTPFELNSSTNNVYVTGATGTVTISYNERRL